jgi:predicted N-acetyltransferase YhbS
MARSDANETAAVERLSGIQTRTDREQVVETFGRAFADPRWMEGHMKRALFQGSVYEPEHTRVAVADGRVVAAVTMAPRDMRFGPVTVPAVTIGPVGTHDAYRKQGYAAAAMDDASRYMAEHGILIAYLQGIPDFYYRFGYYPYMAPGGVKLERRNAAKEAGEGRLRTMRRKDLRSVRRLYDAATADRICAAARDGAVWDWLLGPGKKTWLFREPKVILDGRGRVRGYLTGGHHEEPHLGELIVSQNEGSYRAALGALVKEAKRREAKEIGFPVPWDDGFPVFLRQHVEAEWRMWSGSSGGALLKVVDLPALMRRLEPLFTQRWREARSALPPARFTLKSEPGRVGFAVSDDGVEVDEPAGKPFVTVPQRWLSGLLTGYHTAEQIAPRKGASAPEGLLAYLRVLFPPGWPFVYQGDNY